LCPADVYESLLRAVGVGERDLRPWLDAWDRIADLRDARATPAEAPHAAEPATGSRLGRPVLLPHSEMHYRLRPARRRMCRAGIVTGDLRRVKNVDVWVNSENTNMQMSRFEEYSVSAIIRFEGAVLDEAGRVVDDLIATELTTRLAGRTPVAPGTAVATPAGELTRRNGVRYVIHVAAVSGEPGGGYRQIRDVGRCVTNALAEAERLGDDSSPVRTILFPILGVGVGGGELGPTVRELVAAAVDHLLTWPTTRLTTVYFLASTADELLACRTIFDGEPRLAKVGGRAVD
jgi:hypothetical protein